MTRKQANRQVDTLKVRLSPFIALVVFCPLLLKVTFDSDKFSREVHTKTTNMMVESSMNVCLIALSSILRYNICKMKSLNCLDTKKR